ncbi:MAG: DNA polymerase III subunit epsilon [Gammaproteobacteria bacterium]
MRQLVLDTETTGLDPSEGHRIIEIGCVEIIDRRITERRYHQYISPDREIEEGALAVHGITMDFLKGCPRFDAIVEEFLDFVRSAAVIVHNAAFDVAFINHELARLAPERGILQDYCTISDSLDLARDLHPGQKNSLDALCGRYRIDNSKRELHGALVDAGLLAEVYLAMTGGQASLLLPMDIGLSDVHTTVRAKLKRGRFQLAIIRPSEEELLAHKRLLEAIDRASGGKCLWKHLEGVTRGSSNRTQVCPSAEE